MNATEEHNLTWEANLKTEGEKKTGLETGLAKHLKYGALIPLMKYPDRMT